MIKHIIQKILFYSARNTLKRNNFKIIAITGSAGKTSTRKAVTLVLKTKYKVLSDFNSGYNTEYGLPLTLLERRVPKNKFMWALFIIYVPFLSFKKKNYDFCILEMGADKPGDIEYLTSIAKPHISVLTNIFPTHLEEFKSIQNVALEKVKIFSRLEKGDFAIFNSDTDYFTFLKIPEAVKKLVFGKRKSSDVVIVDQKYNNLEVENIYESEGEQISIKSKSLGEPSQYIFASAIAVGRVCGITTQNIRKALENFEPVPGRMNVLAGKNSAIVIDDSYNANPASYRAAIDAFDKVIGKRKIAAFGSMNELGGASEEAHLGVGNYIADKCDILITVGEHSNRFIKKGAIASGLDPDKVQSYEDSTSAGEYLSSIIQRGDVILVKGSQNNVRMELLVTRIMAHPEMAHKLLCRQGGIWEAKK